MDTTVNNYPERFLTYLEVEKIVLSIRLKAIKRIWLPLRSLCCAETSRIFLAADRSFGCAWLSRRA